MSTPEPLARKLPSAASYSPRDVLSAAWPLFQVSLLGCLPLAVLGVAAGATPTAEAAASADPRGLMRDPQYWGLYVASTLLVLICYGGILRQQLALSRGTRLGVLDSMKQAAIGLPGALGVLVPASLLVVLPGRLLVWLGRPGLGLIVLVLSGLAVLVAFYYAWVAQIDARLLPLAAIQRGLAAVRGRIRMTAAIVATGIAAILVFVLLTGILLAVVMNLAGVGAGSGHAGLTFSRWLMAALLSLPVVYAGAVTVSAWNAAALPRN